MASAPPAPAQQEAHETKPQKTPTPASTPTSPPTHSLDNLQAMLNLVLVSSGSFLKQQQAGPDAGRMQHTLKRAVIAANERFHDDLDELENEIQQAQTVLRRDLALLRADRKKREAAAKEEEAERARLAAESSVKNAPPKKEEPPALAAPAGPDPPAPSNKAPTPTAEPPALKREMEEAPPPALPTSAPAEDTHMEDTKPGDTNGADDFDFDALFNDPVMDGSGDDANKHDMNMDTAGPDLNFTLDESAPSLLRGLEDFAKGGGEDNGAPPNTNGSMDTDYPMTDVPDATGHQSSHQNNTTKPAEDTNTQPPITNDDMNLDTMATDNLDDLFGMDYENPEASQFNDAFFGFGES